MIYVIIIMIGTVSNISYFHAKNQAIKKPARSRFVVKTCLINHLPIPVGLFGFTPPGLLGFTGFGITPAGLFWFTRAGLLGFTVAGLFFLYPVYFDHFSLARKDWPVNPCLYFLCHQ